MSSTAWAAAAAASLSGLPGLSGRSGAVHHASRGTRSLITIQVGEATAANLDSDLFKLNSRAVVRGLVTKQQQHVTVNYNISLENLCEAFTIQNREERWLRVQIFVPFHFISQFFLIFLVWESLWVVFSYTDTKTCCCVVCTKCSRWQTANQSSTEFCQGCLQVGKRTKFNCGLC